MLDRIINWAKSLFHEETPEEQDKRIHETIKSYTDSADEKAIKSAASYYERCHWEWISHTTAEIPGQEHVTDNHLGLWEWPMPQAHNKDNVLKVLTDWHKAHLLLSDMYCYDIGYPPDDPRYGQIRLHVDVRPAKWLKDLADEEKIIKALQMKEDAKQYKV